MSIKKTPHTPHISRAGASPLNTVKYHTKNSSFNAEEAIPLSRGCSQRILSPDNRRRDVFKVPWRRKKKVEIGEMVEKKK